MCNIVNVESSEREMNAVLKQRIVAAIATESKGKQTYELKQNKLKTRNAWQSLAYSPLSAVVSPPSEYL